MLKPRLREVKGLTQYHTAEKWRGLSPPGVSVANPCTFPYNMLPLLLFPSASCLLGLIQTLKDLGPGIPPPRIF